jgi:hypothetical protein
VQPEPSSTARTPGPTSRRTSSIAWDDQTARDALVSALVTDANLIVDGLRGAELDEPAARAVALLATPRSFCSTLFWAINMGPRLPGPGGAPYQPNDLDQADAVWLPPVRDGTPGRPGHP